MATFNPFQSTGGAFTGALTGNTFPGLSLQQTNEIKARAKTMSDDPFEQMLIQDDMYKSELANKQHQTFMQNRQTGRMALDQQALTSKDVKTQNTATATKKMGALADMYRQYGYEHGKNWDSMADEELISRFNTKNPQVKKYADAFLTGGDDSEQRLAQQLGITTNARKKLDDNFWSELGATMKTKAQEPINSMKKWGQRTLNELGAKIYKEILGGVVGDKIKDATGLSIDEYVDTISDKVIDPVVRENIQEYQDKVNEEYRALEQKNLDQDIQNYYNRKGYTETLKEGDFKGFLLKSLGDAASNREMPVVIAASVFQPEVGFALMATDTYARENQEAYENMLDNGATYDQAEKGAVVVGLVNAAVEVGLEKLLGGVETKASEGIRKTFMKNVQEEATKKGLGKILVEGVGTQLHASAEEGLEEIVQQIVQNAAVKTVNENQDLFQGLGQAFEGGFYNPMNLLAGGGNLTQNIKQNRDIIRQSIVDNARNNTNQNTNTDNRNILDRVTDYGAQLITDTVGAQDKLYKAQEPRMNTLTSKKDLSKRRANSDRANQLIVENGYVPTNTTERVEAHQATLNKLWNQVKEQVNQGEGITVDQTPIIEALRNYIEEKKSLNIAAIESDITALEKELASLEKAQQEGTTDLPTLENKKQVYNDLIDWKGQEASEVYKAGLKLLTAEIGKIEDSILSEIPGEFSNLKRDVGALIDAYDDVFKADMKNQRSKGMGLTEAYSRIEGVGDIIEGALGIFKGEGGKVLKGLGKVALGKSLAKAKDVDFLVQQGFKELASQIQKNQNNNETYKNQIEEGAQPVAEMTEDEKYQETVNRIMTPEEAKQILEMTWNANNLKDFYEGKYNNAEEWLKGEGSDQVEMYAENTFATQRMLEAHPELLDHDYQFSEVLDAYLNGTLVGTEKAEVGDIDLSQPVEYTPTKFYEPQQIKDGKALREKANQRVTKSNRNEVYKARGEFITQAHDQNFVTELGLTDAEVNKKLKERSNYTVRSKELSNRINRGVAPQYRRAGLENSSIVNEFAVTDEDLENMVKKVEGKSEEYERKYISNAMLALNTHIDWSNLTFQFVSRGSLGSIDGSTKIAGDYNPYEDIIRIANSGQNTVAHEMGHFLDYLWGRQLYGYNVTLSEGGSRATSKTNLTEDQAKFVSHFDNFMTNLRNNSDLSNNYLMTPTEMFARFVARFTEWTRKTATNNRFDYETKYYNDKYLDKDYIEFTKLLQEKSKLDLENNYSNYEEYKNRRGDKKESGNKTYELRDGRGSAIQYRGENLSEEILTELTNDMTDIADKNGINISVFDNTTLLADVLDYLSEINSQLPKWKDGELINQNISKEVKNIIYKYKNNILREIKRGIESGEIDAKMDWFKDEITEDNGKKRVVPTVRVTHDGNEWWYHIPDNVRDVTDLNYPPKNIREWTPRGQKNIN